MKHDTYLKLRAYCIEGLRNYGSEGIREVKNEGESVGGSKLSLIYDSDFAYSLLGKKLPVRESAAANLLYVIAKHRLETWKREPHPVSDYTKELNPQPDYVPLQPLTQDEILALEKETYKAIQEYSAHLPEREEKAMLSCWQSRFDDFVKQAAPAASGTYEPLCPLLADYWDKPRSELPENLQARVSMQKKRRKIGERAIDVKVEEVTNVKLGRGISCRPVWEEVYQENLEGEWLADWDKMTPEERKTCARNIDDKHKIKTKEQSEIDAAYTQAAYVETGLNGASINWRYWVHQMPVLSAAQAACLMSALEPDLFANLDGQPGHNDPTEYIQKARKIQRLAEALGKLTASPAEWVEWAQSLNPPIKVHVGFLLAVRYPPEPSTGQNEAAKKAEATTGSVGAATNTKAVKQTDTTTGSGDAAAKVEDVKKDDSKSCAKAEGPEGEDIGRRDRQIEAIIEQANYLSYPIMAIPYGGKAKIRNECLKNGNLFISADAFDHAWKEAKKRGVIEVDNVESYRSKPA